MALGQSMVFFLLISSQHGLIECKCPGHIIDSMQMILEYALWRGWDQLVLFKQYLSVECDSTLLRFSKCLSLNGISTQLSSNDLSESTLNLMAHRLGIVVLVPNISDARVTHQFDYFLKRAGEKDSFREYHEWLLIVNTFEDTKDINEKLLRIPFRFDTLMVAGIMAKINNYITNIKSLCGSNVIRLINNDSSSLNWDGNSYILTKNIKQLVANESVSITQSGLNFKGDRNFTGMLPLYEYNTVLESDKGTNVSNHASRIRLYQYFRVREDTPFYAYYMGEWCAEHSMSRVNPVFPVEFRNFLEETIKVGQKNDSLDDDSDDDSVNTDEAKIVMMEFILKFINATPQEFYYSKFGSRLESGQWTGMLGAVVSKEIDVSREIVTADFDRQMDMDFIFPIIKSMRNIYFRQTETTAIRDIFLAPFTPRLLASVVLVSSLMALGMTIISATSSSIIDDDEGSISRSETFRRSMNFRDVLLWWSIIICQQGYIPLPNSKASVVLFSFCLVFGIVVYSSYASFITSVLALQASSLDSVDDFIHDTNFRIGFISNSQDQLYLKNSDDYFLRMFYANGMMEPENLVTSADEGLIMATSNNYALFLSQRIARNALINFSNDDRCQIVELEVGSTLRFTSFPIAKESPYRKPILMSLMTLRESGVLTRVQKWMLPEMPLCLEGKSFNSAKISDIYSALSLITFGILSGLSIGLCEFFWLNRITVRSTLKKYSGLFYSKKNIIRQNKESNLEVNIYILLFLFKSTFKNVLDKNLIYKLFFIAYL